MGKASQCHKNRLQKKKNFNDRPETKIYFTCMFLVNVSSIQFIGLFSIHLAYLFRNFRVGGRQRGFRIKGVKGMGRNRFPAVLYRIAGIPVVRDFD